MTAAVPQDEDGAQEADPYFQELILEPMDDVARFNAQQDFTKPGVVMGADGLVHPYFPPPWMNHERCRVCGSTDPHVTIGYPVCPNDDFHEENTPYVPLWRRITRWFGGTK